MTPDAIFIKQAYAESVINAVILSLGMMIVVCLVITSILSGKKDPKSFLSEISGVAAIIMTFLIFILSFIYRHEIITGITNPEFRAIKIRKEVESPCTTHES